MRRATEASVPWHCERCLSEHRVELPRRGSRDLEFHHVAAAFRFCVGCERYVGRSCCWRPDAVACADCAAGPPLIPATPVNESPEPAWQRGVRHLQSAVQEFEQLVESLASGSDARPRQGVAWIGTWMSAGLLDARIQSARDAIAKQIWNAPVQARPAAAEVDENVQRLLASREVAAARVTDLLTAQWQPPHAQTVWSRLGVHTVAGEILAVAVLGAGIVGVASGAWADMISSAPSPEAVDTRTPVSVASASDHIVTASAVPSHALVSGEWTFDELRMGAIANQLGATVEGGGDVVAFPTAVDRSVRLPAGTARPLCFGREGIAGSAGALSFDLYVGNDVPATAGLRAALAVSPAVAHAVSVRPEDLGGGIENQWIRVRLTWSEPPTFGLEASLRDGGAQVRRVTLTASPIGSMDRALCMWQEGEPASGEMLVDKVRLEN